MGQPQTAPDPRREAAFRPGFSRTKHVNTTSRGVLLGGSGDHRARTQANGAVRSHARRRGAIELDVQACGKQRRYLENPTALPDTLILVTSTPFGQPPTLRTPTISRTSDSPQHLAAASTSGSRVVFSCARRSTGIRRSCRGRRSPRIRNSPPYRANGEAKSRAPQPRNGVAIRTVTAVPFPDRVHTRRP